MVNDPAISSLIIGQHPEASYFMWLAADIRHSYSPAMHQARPIVALLIVLTLLESILFGVESASPLSTVKDGILLSFLFVLPGLLLGGLIFMRQPWAVVGTVIYCTIALALDLATIVQESNQPSPSQIVLLLILGSSLVNFVIMILGGRCLLTYQPGQRPTGDHRPKYHFPSSS